MDTPIKNVELSFSCPAKWENLSDMGNNKYCANCGHLVIDFTKLSQEEFNYSAKNAPGRLCGRFKSSQMSSRFLKYAAVSAMAASVLLPTSCISDDPAPADNQTPPSTEQALEEPEDAWVVGIIFIPEPASDEADSILLEGPVDEGSGQSRAI